MQISSAMMKQSLPICRGHPEVACLTPQAMQSVCCHLLVQEKAKTGFSMVKYGMLTQNYFTKIGQVSKSLGGVLLGEKTALDGTKETQRA
jgi:hypothetical protein